MSKKELKKWATDAYWYMISEYAVAAVTSESPYALELALEWIDSDKENIASAGWATLSGYVGITANEAIDTNKMSELIDRVVTEIGDLPPNRVRYTMNGFVIAVGSYIPELTKQALAAGEKIGKVEVDMNGTACKVPLAVPYINKVIQAGRHGKKRKVARC